MDQSPPYTPPSDSLNATECHDNAEALCVLLGCVARMAPVDDAELAATVRLARAIAGELNNDLAILLG